MYLYLNDGGFAGGTIEVVWSSVGWRAATDEGQELATRDKSWRRVTRAGDEGRELATSDESWRRVTRAGDE